MQRERGFIMKVLQWDAICRQNTIFGLPCFSGVCLKCFQNYESVWIKINIQWSTQKLNYISPVLVLS